MHRKYRPRQKSFTARKDSILLTAVDSRDIDAIRSAVAEGANVNAIINYDSPDMSCVGYPALVKAAFMGWDDVVTCLLENNADIDAGDKNNITSLMWSVISKHSSTTEILVQYGANVLAENNFGQTAINLAMRYGDLVTAGSLIKISNLQMLSKEKRLAAVFLLCSNNQVEDARCLAGNGINVFWSDREGRSPLHIAADTKNYSAIEILLAHYADINAMTFNGITPIMTAVEREDYLSLQLLLEAGANVTLQDSVSLFDV
jgi:ankyrin repeat protein